MELRTLEPEQRVQTQKRLPLLWRKPLKVDGTIEGFLAHYDNIISALHNDATQAELDWRVQLRSILQLALASLDVQRIFVGLDPAVPHLPRRFEVDTERMKITDLSGGNSLTPPWVSDDETRLFRVPSPPPGSGTLATLSIQLRVDDELDLVKVRLIESLFRMMTQIAYEAEIRLRLEDLLSSFQESIAQKIRFGTLLSRETANLSKILRVNMGFLSTVFKGRAIPIYSAGHSASRGEIIKNRRGVQLPRRITQALAAGEPFYTEYDEDLSPLVLRISRTSAKRIRRRVGDLLFIPILSDGEVIAFYTGIWYDQRPKLAEQHFESLRFWARLAEIPSKYMFQAGFNRMIIEPVFQSRNTRIEMDKCCVLMPFTEDWSTRIWSKVVSPALQSMNLKPVRADDLYGHDVMEDIWEMINTSEFVIADITGRNANVFYELGIAHTLGKKVVLLTQSTKDIPFDLNRYRHIIYEDNIDGAEYLNRQLIQKIAEMKKPVSSLK